MLDKRISKRTIFCLKKLCGTCYLFFLICKYIFWFSTFIYLNILKSRFKYNLKDHILAVLNYLEKVSMIYETQQTVRRTAQISFHSTSLKNQIKPHDCWKGISPCGDVNKIDINLKFGSNPKPQN